MITKKKLLRIIQNLPERFSADELIDRIAFVRKIEAGLEQSSAGKILSTFEAKKRLKKWLK